MTTKTELDKAYRATTYRLYLPEGALDLRVDAASPALAAWLKIHHVDKWAIMTAANPGSQRLGKQENAERQAKLECALLEAGLEPFVVENLADDPSWPIEESCFVPGIPEQTAMALAEQFGQNAILLGREDGIPRLVWTKEHE